MQQRQGKSSSGVRTDEELKTALERAVADAERVISGSTLPLPFDGDESVVDDSDESAEEVPEVETSFFM